MKKHLITLNLIIRNVVLNLIQDRKVVRQRISLCALIIFMAIFSTLSTGVETFALETPSPAVQVSVPTKQITPSVAEPNSIPEKNAYGLTHMQKGGFKDSILKFFLAMLGVLISSGAIFMGLNFYKKFVLKNNAKIDDIDYNKTLESPKDFKEAINLFLDKTDKQ